MPFEGLRQWRRYAMPLKASVSLSQRTPDKACQACTGMLYAGQLVHVVTTHCN